MNLKYDSKVRGLLASAEAQGFRLEHAGKCFKMYPPDKSKPIITISCTPSDCNFFWELRRHLKRCGYVEAAA
jgi:hypothetical protein